MDKQSSNPFATRYIRPGAVEFIFPAGQSVESLIERLRENQWCGQIVGPHGSGKSTLLAVVVPALKTAGRNVVEVKVQRSEVGGPLPNMPHVDENSLNATTLLVIDGFEQLNWWRRQRLKQLCRRKDCGLLTTTHRDLGLPTIVTTQPTLALASAVVARLIPSGETIAAEDIASAYDAARGDIRETLFTLYDIYQQRAKA